MHLLVIDFETYYCTKKKYTLKKLTYEQYIRNAMFDVIGLAVKLDDEPTKFLAPHEITDYLNYIKNTYGWENIRLVAFNARFDAAILGWCYGVYPAEIADPMLMSRAMKFWDGNSLDVVTEQLKEKFNWGCYHSEEGLYCGDVSDIDTEYLLHKGDEVVNADGKALMEFTDEEYDRYAEYCCNDVDLTYSAYKAFTEMLKFPEFEIKVMTYTIEMFTYPVLTLDEKVLAIVKEVIDNNRQQLLDKAGTTLADLRSDAKFAEMLIALGVEPPTKVNKKGETKYAFAKNDLGFLALLDHENEDVVNLVKARLGNKSSQAVTRVQSFLELAGRGKLPMPLEYYAAHTGRWGGCLTANTVVIIKTPDGLVCERLMIDVGLDDLVWDGEEFVSHDGLQYRGEQYIYHYNGKGGSLTGTYDHPVMVNGEWVALGTVIEKGLDIDRCEKPECDEKLYSWGVLNPDVSHTAVYDIVNCGPRHRFWANGFMVHNSDAINVQNLNRNQLVNEKTEQGTYVFYDGKADRVVKVLNQGKEVLLARRGQVENDEERLHIFGLRDSFKAPKGKTLVVFDLSQVELRFNSWLWDEKWILDTLVAGKDIYKVTATSTFKVPYEEVTKSQRFVGKSQQLGLGYMAGTNGLTVVMGKRSEEFTQEQLQSFVDAYRQSCPNIADGWKQCRKAMENLATGVSQEIGNKGIIQTISEGILMPNGLSIRYRGMHKREGDRGYPEFVFWGKNKITGKPDWEKTHPGKIDENIVQALCRIILSEMIYNIREDFKARGWTKDDAHVCMQVHDEIITCCKEEIAKEVAEIMQTRMKESPRWCSSLPLNCAGDIANRYGCAK